MKMHILLHGVLTVKETSSLMQIKTIFTLLLMQTITLQHYQETCLMRCAHIVTINILSCYVYHSIYRDTYIDSNKRILMVYKIYDSMWSLMGRSTT